MDFKQKKLEMEEDMKWKEKYRKRQEKLIAIATVLAEKHGVPIPFDLTQVPEIPKKEVEEFIKRILKTQEVNCDQL